MTTFKVVESANGTDELKTTLPNSNLRVNTWRFEEGIRTFTIIFTNDRITGETKYGASIFRKVSKTDIFNKKEHAKTAYARFTNCPVILTIKRDTCSNIVDLRKKIRKCLFTHGVKCSHKSPTVGGYALDGTHNNYTSPANDIPSPWK